MKLSKTSAQALDIGEAAQVPERSKIKYQMFKFNTSKSKPKILIKWIKTLDSELNSTVEKVKRSFQKLFS